MQAAEILKTLEDIADVGIVNYKQTDAVREAIPLVKKCSLHLLKDALELLKMMQMTDEKEMSRNNYAAQMETLGYEPDGNPKIRYQWIHEEPAKSSRFRCSGCGKAAYYPQANGSRKNGLRMPYEHCPFCGRHMITIWEELK